MDEKKDQTPPDFPVEFPDGLDDEKQPRFKRIMFHFPSDGQLAVIARGARRAMRGGGANALEAIGLILDVIDKMVVDPDDRNWLEDGLINASLSLDDFIAVMDGINADDDGDEEESRPARKSVAATARARSNGRR
jgi:hypothetical protein